MYFFPITVKQNGDIPASYVSLPGKFSHPHSIRPRLRNQGFTRPWAENEKRENRIIFIGRGMQPRREKLTEPWGWIHGYTGIRAYRLAI